MNSNSNITTPICVRDFKIDELDAFLVIRRQALATNPEAFGDTIEKMDAREKSFEQDRFLANVERDDQLLIGAFENERCVAMTGLFHNSEPGYEGRGTIWGVFVRPEYRGRRLGERMIEAVFSRARTWKWLDEIVLFVKTDNHHAIRLYERLGMKIFEPADTDPVFSTPCARETHLRWTKEF